MTIVQFKIKESEVKEVEQTKGIDYVQDFIESKVEEHFGIVEFQVSYNREVGEYTIYDVEL